MLRQDDFYNYPNKVTAKNLHYKEDPLWKYDGVLKRGRMLAPFDPVRGLVQLWRHPTETKNYHEREVTSSVTLCNDQDRLCSSNDRSWFHGPNKQEIWILILILTSKNVYEGKLLWK
jgi:hypothetical protein